VKVGIVRFPGSNCEVDCQEAFLLAGVQAELLWHQETSVKGYDLIVLPGGFSYGDYLRTGAIARFSPIMDDVIRFAEAGGYVWGICNGFQMLTECGLLPGALLRNAGLNFICAPQYLRVENNRTFFTASYQEHEVVQFPVNHGEGNYYIDEDSLAALEASGRVVFRYVDRDGQRTPTANPNGSLHDIAGIINASGNVLGMMPHPERAAEALLGGVDGLRMFRTALAATAEGGWR
jgi:phosphoribosylformylglycinamidine synthase